MAKQPNIIVQLKNAPSILADIQQPLIDFTKHPQTTFCLVEPSARMPTPRVIIISSEGDVGSIAFEATLDLYLKSAVRLLEIAKAYGWPVGDEVFAGKEAKKELVRELVNHLTTWADRDD